MVVHELGREDSDNSHVVDIRYLLLSSALETFVDDVTSGLRREHAGALEGGQTRPLPRSIQPPRDSRMPVRRARDTAASSAEDRGRHDCGGRALEDVLFVEDVELVGVRQRFRERSDVASRKGKRPSTECAMSIRSPWEDRR